jgi:hypothetical protein
MATSLAMMGSFYGLMMCWVLGEWFWGTIIAFSHLLVLSWSIDAFGRVFLAFSLYSIVGVK